MNPKWGAFIEGGPAIEPTETGPLSGLTFAAKDVFAVAGHRSGAGNPDWLRTHEPQEAHAEAVDRLLRAGARLVGMTHTDELMYSLNGENAHYGTPVNPKAPARIPGGSSSGSAVAVAAGEADFAIGTDTGGSVRVPASYCGIYGFRPTHGAVSTEGVIPLAAEFDTVGWMAADPRTMAAVGRVLLAADGGSTGAEADAGAADASGARMNAGGARTDAVGARTNADAAWTNAVGARAEETAGSAQATAQTAAGPRFARVFAVREAWELADGECREALEGACGVWMKDAAETGEISVTDADNGLSEWLEAFRYLQGLEIARTHGRWIAEVRPAFGPGVAERFAWAASLKQEDGEKPAEMRREARRRLSGLLRNDTVLLLPTVPGPAPLLGLGGEQLERRRMRTMQLTCIAGLGGLPQLTVPIGEADGAPVGLSVIGGPGTDLRLLEWAAAKALEFSR